MTLWWGHRSGDATWACNAWHPRCSNNGGCYAKNDFFFTRQYKTINTYVRCSGNGGTCNPYGDITLGRFRLDRTDQIVWGCPDGFRLTGLELSVSLQREPSVDVSLSFAQDASFTGWQGCCAVAGHALQSRGLLSEGWWCQHDLFRTHIYLRGKAS